MEPSTETNSPDAASACGRDSYDSLLGISHRIGTYHQFYRLVMEPRQRAGTGSPETLRAFVVKGTFYLSGSGKTYIIVRQHSDQEFFRDLPSVMGGEEFMTLCRTRGIDYDLEPRGDDDAEIRHPDVVCAWCKKGWPHDLPAAANYGTLCNDVEAPRYYHPGCITQAVAQERERIAASAREYVTQLVADAGFGEDLRTTVSSAPVPDILVAGMREDSTEEHPTNDWFAQEWAPYFVRVRSVLGTFFLMLDDDHVVIYIAHLEIVAEDLGVVIPPEHRLSAEPLPFAFTVNQEGACMAVARLCNCLLKKERERLRNKVRRIQLAMQDE